METKNVTDVFVDTLYQLANRPIPEEVLLEARKSVLDVLGCMFGGSAELKDKLHAYLDLLPETPGGVTVVNLGRRASLQNAALVNGMIAHVLEMDDGHRFSTVHLSATTIPAVLAVCEYFDLTMEDLLRGVVVGYETSIRMGRCLQPAHRARGYHSSGTVGTLGAAMGVAAALRFDRAMTKAALAAAASSAAGLNEMLDSVSMKPFNVGRAGQDGVTAALIAKVGFEGPIDPLGGKFGFLHAMAESCDISGLSLENDPGWGIMGAYRKPYAACRHTHPAIDCALGLLAAHHLNTADIEKIEIRTYLQGLAGHDHTDIPTLFSGKMSTPFCVALALRTGSAGITAFGEENIQDEEIRRLCRVTTVAADEAMTAMVPKKRSTDVAVVLKDGTRYNLQVDYAKGEPEAPMTVEDFNSKFSDLAGYGGKSAAEVKKIADVVLTHNGPVAALMELIG